MRHTYDFGVDRELVGHDLLRPDAWDALRFATNGPFAMENDRDAWVSAATRDPNLARRAAAINDVLDRAGARSVASYGVGGGALEYLTWSARPHRPMTVSDFGPATVSKLDEVFPEADAYHHDLLHDEPLDADVHLFHRVDTELGDDQWRALLRRFDRCHVVVAAAAVLGPVGVALQLLGRLRARNSTHAGWVRTRPRFEELWASTHVARPAGIGDLWGWHLRPRR